MFITDLSLADETIVKRLLTNPSVDGIIMTNEQGQLQYTTMDNNITFLISSKLLFLANKAREVVRDFDPADNLITFRLRTRSKEMMVVTPDEGMQIIAIQKIQPSVTKTQLFDDDFKDNM